MWIFTNFGFFSVVQKGGDDDLTVRVRVGSDLDRLREQYLPELGPTVEGSGTDYRYRATVPSKSLGAALAAIVRGIDYSNFKDSVAHELGHRRADVMHGIWREALRLEEVTS